jgi:MFS transporter, SP family, xylose:H+ symportor
LVTGLTFVATLGGLLFGYDTAVISGAVTSIDANFIDPQHLSETARNSLSGWTVSSALFGCIIGAIVAGWVSNAIGRKGGMIVAGALFLISAAGSAYPEFGLGPIGGMGPAALTPFIMYRILCGVGVGIASMLSPLYIAEIAPSRIRGRLVSFNQLSIVLGMLLVYFVNWGIASQGDEAWIQSTGWRLMLVSEAIPALLFLALLTLVPDTPRWLAMKGRHDKALAVLNRLVGEREARTTLQEIEASLVVPEHSHTGLFAFGSMVVVVGVLLSLFQQFVGINVVLYYAPLMFKNLGASTDSALMQTIIVGIANVLFTVIAILTVDRLGRKPLLIIGGLVMGVAMVTLGFLFQAKSVGAGPLVAAIAYIAGFALSWGPVTWVLLSEMFPNSVKSKAMALAVAAQWIANLFVSWSFKILIGNSVLNTMFNHGFP